MSGCPKPVGSRPSWMSVDQWETDGACKCALPLGHNGYCKCAHMLQEADRG